VSESGESNKPRQATGLDFGEGVEELELLRMLRELGGGSVADEIVASVCRGVRDFSRDPNELDAAKERIVQEIMKRQ